MEREVAPLPGEVIRVVNKCREVFQFDTLKTGQQEVIIAALRGLSYLAVMPTGGGKTLTMIIPQLLQQRGVTLVVCPTVSLIVDLCRRLDELKVSAVYNFADLRFITDYHCAFDN